jgi:hypothetical protein
MEIAGVILMRDEPAVCDADIRSQQGADDLILRSM